MTDSEAELRRELAKILETGAMTYDGANKQVLFSADTHIDAIMAAVARHDQTVEQAARIAGMKTARDRVLRRTEIPKDAKNPTRDMIVVIGEECARIIDEDIAALQTNQPGDENG